MKTYPLKKVDTRLYVQSLSGKLVYKALYGVLIAIACFMGLYIVAGTFIASLVCIPSFFTYLYRLNQIQKKLGSNGWDKKQVAKKLPQFNVIKKRLFQSCHHEF